MKNETAKLIQELYDYDEDARLEEYRSSNVLAKPKLRARVWDKTNGKCWYCGKQTNPHIDFSIDHLNPRAKGGVDDIKNLVPACRTCNARKHTRTLDEFRELMSRIANGVILFSKDQIAYLNSLGVTDLLPKDFKEYIFYFETLERNSREI